MKKTFNILYLIIAILITFLQLIGIYEILNIKLLGNADQYPFGSEKAISEGGEHYINEESYIMEISRDIIIWTPAIILIWVGQIKKRNTIKIIALMLIIAIIIGNRFILLI